MTNTSIQYVDYCTDCFDRLNSILSKYSVEKTLDFFENKLGVHLQYKENLVYPFSNKSSTVVNAFKMYLSSNVEIRTGAFVKTTKKNDEIFEVNTNIGEYKSRNIVFAGGGSAAPKTGSDGNIYKLILPYANRSDFNKVTPSLVQFKTFDTDAHKLAGTRVKAEVFLCSGEEVIASSSGEMMFTDYGLSGICIFDLSSYYYSALDEGKKNIQIRANLMPGENVDEILSNRMSLFPNRDMNSILSGFFTTDVADFIVNKSNSSLESISNTIRNLTFSISGTMGFDNAQVTSGGLKLSSLDDYCMLSEGIYVIGETVDVDGPCGGYNLQWAWSSAMASATKISERLS